MTSRAILCQCLLLWWWHVTDCQNGVLLEIQWYLSLSLLHFLNFHISGTEQKFLSSSNMQQSLWWTLKSRIDYLICFPLEQINITKGTILNFKILPWYMWPSANACSPCCAGQMLTPGPGEGPILLPHPWQWPSPLWTPRHSGVSLNTGLRVAVFIADTGNTYCHCA